MMYDEILKPCPDPETRAFEESLMRSLEQAKSGEYACIHAPEMIAGYKRRGRPVGTIKSDSKISTTIRLSRDVSDTFRATGRGWQTRLDNALKDWLKSHSPA